MKATDPLLTQAIEALRQALGDGLISVILFGSRARGDARDGSDWDLLVIADGLPERRFQRHLFLKRILPVSCRGSVSLLAKTPHEFEAHVPALYLDIALDGQILYDPRGYGARRLAELRRLIGRQGLYRERTPAGDVWRWHQAPAQPWTLQWSS